MRKLCGAVSRVDYFPRVLEVTVSIGQFDKSFITLAAEVSLAKIYGIFLRVNSLKRYSKGGNGKNEEFDQIW